MTSYNIIHNITMSTMLFIKFYKKKTSPAQSYNNISQQNNFWILNYYNQKF